MKRKVKRIAIAIVVVLAIVLGIFIFFNKGPTGTVTSCLSGQTFCGLTCTDTQSDSLNCGACGNSCASGQTCQNGGCTSSSISVSAAWISALTSSNGTSYGFPSSPTVTPTVINVQSNSYPLKAFLQLSASGIGYIIGNEFYLDGLSLGYHSYSCYASPPGCTLSELYSFTTPGIHTYSAAVYSGGNKISTPTYAFDFEPTCSSSQTACSGTCVNTATDSSNCGSCGTACFSYQGCQSGVCTLTASSGGLTITFSQYMGTLYEAVACTTGGSSLGMHIDFYADGNFYSSMTNDWLVSQCYGANAGYSSLAPGTHSVYAVAYDTSGHNVTSIVLTATVQGTNTSCSSGQTLCSGVCVNTQTDTSNCGVCGNTCNTPPSATCNGNNRTTYSSSGTCSTGSCSYTSTSTSCGSASYCSSGSCSSCSSSTANCDGNAANSCETNLQTNDNNCGACGIVCSTGKSCTAGVCTTVAVQESIANGNCNDGIDNDNNGEKDYAGLPHGDSGCPVGITGISVTNSTPLVNSQISAKCNATTSTSSIMASVDGVGACSWDSAFGWLGTTTNFFCNVGATTGTKTVRCAVDPLKSYINGTDKTTTINVQALTTPVLDTTPPVRSNGLPTGTLAVAITSATISLSTNETATCKYSTTAGMAYSSMTNTFTTTGGTTHSATVSSLSSGTTYNYYIRCQDSAGNANTNDFTISFSVPVPDTTPPVRSNGLPTGTLTLSAGTTSTLISLSTNEAAMCKYSTTANTSYNSMASTFTTTGSTLHSALVSGLTNGSTYNYYVRCIDASGNANTNDFTITFSVSAASATPLADTTSPSIPANLFASSVSSSLINLSWSVSTDNVGVIGYRLERCQGSSCTSFVQIATPTATWYSDIGLAVGTAYRYRVRAQDAASNPSNYSGIANATTQQASTNLSTDTTIPSTPTNFVASSVSSSRINLLWSASTDNIGVIGYRLERCQGSSCTSFAQIATPTTTSYSDIGLAVGTAYRYRVRAQDAANNPSNYSSIASATTQQAITTQQTNVTTSTETIPSTTEISKERTYSGLDITPSFPTIIRDFSSAIAVEQITINVNNLAQDVEVTVKTHDGKPAEVSVKKSGKIYQYLQIDTQNLVTELNKATVEFKVEKKWVSVNGLSKDKISVYKFDETGKKWNELQTTFASEDDKYYYYNVELNSFSYFAIAEKEAVTISNIGRETWLLWSLIFATAFVLALIIWRLSARKKQYY